VLCTINNEDDIAAMVDISDQCVHNIDLRTSDLTIISSSLGGQGSGGSDNPCSLLILPMMRIY
jgi:hypothetical protein